MHLFVRVMLVTSMTRRCMRSRRRLKADGIVTTGHRGTTVLDMGALRGRAFRAQARAVISYRDLSVASYPDLYGNSRMPS
jgi:hypothetical protein